MKAKPGVQTGRARADSGAAMPQDTTTPTGNVQKRGAAGYRYTGPATDTALHARPGTQTGKAPADTGNVHKKKTRHHRPAATDSAKSDSTRTHPY